MRGSKIITLTLLLSTLLLSGSFRPEEKVKVGFLIHDLVTDRWRTDMENFAKKITELGGEPVTRNALGNAETQINQGKELIDEGVKVIAVVAQNGNALAELVNYANSKGATIIAYDRMILNCHLPYYISFNSVKVGEFMAGYALRLKPKGNYIVLNGPSSDNNSLLVKKGVMNTLAPSIENGSITILANEDMESWNALSSMLYMQDFVSSNTKPIDAVIAASDDIATGILDVLDTDSGHSPVLTGQNASIDACRNILQGRQTMTVYKDIMKLSSEAAVLAMKIARGEKVKTTATTNNGKIDVPSILFDPVVIDKSNLRALLVPKYVTEEQLR